MAGNYTIDGSVSSQYISGLLMALSNFNRPSTITVTGEVANDEILGNIFSRFCVGK